MCKTKTTIQSGVKKKKKYTCVYRKSFNIKSPQKCLQTRDKIFF